MNCHGTRALLDLHAEGRLNPGRAAALERHLAACAACRALALPSPVTVTAAAPAGLKAKLLAAAKTTGPGQPGDRIGGTLSLLPRDAFAIAVAGAALAVIALGLGWSGAAPNQSLTSGEELAGRMP